MGKHEALVGVNPPGILEEIQENYRKEILGGTSAPVNLVKNPDM